jgi:hypothetical protein
MPYFLYFYILFFFDEQLENPVPHKYALAKGISWRTAINDKGFSSEAKLNFNSLIYSSESDIYNLKNLQNKNNFKLNL